MENINIFDTYTGGKHPETLTKKVKNNTYKFIPYDIKSNDGVYSWKYIEIPPEQFNYNGLIECLIACKYTLRDTIAIMLNYLSDSNNKKYKEELDELQAWRKYAKDYAKEYFNVGK
jgi:hypothetical protein